SWITVHRMAPKVQPHEPRRSDQQSDSAQGAQEHRQAQHGIRSVRSEGVVIDRCCGSGSKAQQEAVEREVMEPLPQQCEPVVLLVAPVAMTSIEIRELERAASRFSQ